MRYAWWNTTICIFCQIINIQYVILVIGGREISRPYPNIGYRFEKFDVVFYQ